MEFWDELQALTFTNEASVESVFVLPLLDALGYKKSDISSKHPIVFQQGRRGRPHEADFAVFATEDRNEDTSLLVIEAKSPGQELREAKAQAESYALCIRAPFFVLTNGLEIEIWQVRYASRSERLLTAKVSELAAKRGEVEELISKDAVISYCRQLKLKTIASVARDFTIYEVAEIQRTSTLAPSVERTLVRSGGTDRWTSTAINGEFPNGALVVGPSGFGKTTLAQKLFHAAIGARHETKHSRLAFDIPLPDLAASNCSTVAFVTSRLAAHCPHVTEATMRQLLREEGLSLYCDGFDRLSAPSQQAIATELRNLQRDFPKVQLFVFSRLGASPNLALETITLSPLDDAQQYSFSKILGIDAYVIQMMPPMLRDLASHPLLFLRILSYWQQNNTYPTNLDSIFSDWLNVVIEHADANAQQAAEREKALSILAEATVDSSISRVIAIELFSSRGIEKATFTELVSCHALQVSGLSVELVHEALADYLRARALALGDEATVIQRLQSVRLDPDSLLPVLLMARLPTRKLQQILWQRLSHVAWDIYLSVLHFRGDTSKDLEETERDIFAKEYLEDLLEGLELPLKGFFEPLQPSVVSNLLRMRSTKLGIAGHMSRDRAEFVYGFVPVDDPMDRISIGPPSLDYGIHILDLESKERRLDRARLIGLQRLQEEIHTAFVNRTLVGGPIWLHERLIGRLRHLAQKHRFPLEHGTSLRQIRDTLRSNTSDLTSKASSPAGTFSIQSVIDDTEELECAGTTELDLWWLRLGWTRRNRNLDNVTVALVKEYFRRAQLIYFEVAQRSFQKVSSSLGFYSSLPVRWIVELQQHSRGTSMRYSWLPVAHWHEATADVSLTWKRPVEDFRTHHQNVETLRTQFGRRSRRPRIFWASGGMPDFPGNSSGETSAFWFACDLIQYDLASLFEGVAHWRRVG
jgi:hypothetical protein